MSATTLVDEIELFPSFGRWAPLTREWQLWIRGRITRRRPDGFTRRLLLRFFQRAFRIPAADRNDARFLERIEGFLAIPRRGLPIGVDGTGFSHELKRRSRRDGHFQETVRLPAENVAVGGTNGKPGSPTWIGSIGPSISDPWMNLEASTDRATPIAKGEIQLLGETGCSVISDIDDTIKWTEVVDRRELMRNTFLRPFSSVDGMQKVYEHWCEAGAAFHYVSSSPWQLFHPLRRFLFDAGFPAGSFHLRAIRFRDPSILQLVVGKTASKSRAIQSILRWFPHRKFILVGDSGEKDPELYGAIARRFPHQIEAIYIRQLPGRGIDGERLERAFAQVDLEKQHVFEQAGELMDIMPDPREGWRIHGVARMPR